MSNDNVVTEKFKEDIREWVELDDQIKQVTDHLKKLKTLKKTRQESTIKFMKQNKLVGQKISISNGGSLKISTIQSVVPVTRQYIVNKLKTFFNSKEKAEEIASYIYDNRETVEKTSMRRYKSKKN
tara:strand:+ start:733 stop:1110 length:378 start_codon:yes stop_codon:yes gene_type:complete